MRQSVKIFPSLKLEDSSKLTVFSVVGAVVPRTIYHFHSPYSIATLYNWHSISILEMNVWIRDTPEFTQTQNRAGLLIAGMIKEGPWQQTAFHLVLKG